MKRKEILKHLVDHCLAMLASADSVISLEDRHNLTLFEVRLHPKPDPGGGRSIILTITGGEREPEIIRVSIS